ncbi:MAG TPA: hypothetical protein VMF58_04045 [Rhizomicrobium sp.]|nr:hypothetical protein [Rhizomicrobium sp.]
MKSLSLFAGAAVAMVMLTAAALSAGSLSIDDIAGAYKDRFQNGLVDGTKFTSEDVLEIVKVSPREAYIRTHLEFYNGHSCSIYGVAKLEGDALAYRPHNNAEGRTCVLTLKRKGDRIIFGDADGACKEYNCGARGSFDGVDFAMSHRRPIRYMKVLLASREYHDALAERDAHK